MFLAAEKEINSQFTALAGLLRVLEARKDLDILTQTSITYELLVLPKGK